MLACARSEDTLNFWKGIADVGLMGEVVTNIRTELLEMLKGVQLRSDHTSLQDSGEPHGPRVEGVGGCRPCPSTFLEAVQKPQCDLDGAIHLCSELHKCSF